MNILIIDDNEMTRAILRTILVNAQHKVVGEASNGKAGIEAARKLMPQVIFLDIVMPDSNGLDILKEILAIVPKAIVLMVTGKNDADTVKTALQGGAKGFIVKPFNASTVLDALKGAVLRAVKAS